MDTSNKTSGIKKIWRGFKAMIRFIMRLISFLMMASFLLWIALLIWISTGASRPPKVESNTVLTLNLAGLITDGPGIDQLTQLLLRQNVQTTYNIVMCIRKAAHDTRIPGILLKTEGVTMNWATAMDLREELLAFKQTGKTIFAYTSDMGMGAYLLLSTADKIFMPPSGSAFMMGLRVEIPFYKDIFDKIGVTPEFIAIGKYKTGPQNFTMNHLSDEYREVMNDLLDAYYSDYIQKVAEARNVSRLQAAAWIDDGLYTAREALDAGMVDELRYESQINDLIVAELGLASAIEAAPTPSEATPEAVQTPNEKTLAAPEKPKLQTISGSKYVRVKLDAPGLHVAGQKIAVVYASGTIVSGKAPLASGATIGAETLSRLITDLKEDSEIAGIILRLDSGGGSASASDLIRNSIQETAATKPVIVSMTDAAASGGYMISAPATKIVAYPTTLTGSIGIYGGKFSLDGLNDWLGLKIETLQRGQNAGMFSSVQPQTPEEQERFRQYIQQGYDDFVKHVAEGRNMTLATAGDIAEGRVWTGAQAIDIGLVDMLGNLETAIALLKEQLALPAEEDVQVLIYPHPESPLELFAQQFEEALIRLSVPKDVLRLRGQLEPLVQLQHERRFAWQPARIVLE